MTSSFSTPTANSSSLTGGVKDTLLDWLREGRYPPGSRLPSVPQLVEKLGVSRTVVREALQALVGMHLIDMRPGMGTFVRSVPGRLIANADVMASLITPETMKHVVEARIVLESGVAALAAVTATEEDFAQMEEIVRMLGTTAALNRPVFALTPAFHVACARATQNPVLEGVVASFNALMAKTGELLEGEAGEGFQAAEYTSHNELLQSLRTRDPEIARTAMAEHIRKTLDALNQVLVQEPSAAKA